jgi:hypothetical protein
MQTRREYREQLLARPTGVEGTSEKPYVQVMPVDINLDLEGIATIESTELVNALLHRPNETLSLMQEMGSKVPLESIWIGPRGEVLIYNEEFRIALKKRLLDIAPEHLVGAGEGPLVRLNIICGLGCI